MSSAGHGHGAEGLQALERNDYPEVSAVYQREREAEGLQAVEQKDKEVVPSHGMKTDSAVHIYSVRDFDHVHTKHQGDSWTKGQESKALLGLVQAEEMRLEEVSCLASRLLACFTGDWSGAGWHFRHTSTAEQG